MKINFILTHFDTNSFGVDIDLSLCEIIANLECYRGMLTVSGKGNKNIDKVDLAIKDLNSAKYTLYTTIYQNSEVLE